MQRPGPGQPGPGLFVWKTEEEWDEGDVWDGWDCGKGFSLKAAGLSGEAERAEWTGRACCVGATQRQR